MAKTPAPATTERVETVLALSEKLVAPENVEKLHEMSLEQLHAIASALGQEIHHSQEIRNSIETEIGRRHERITRMKNFARATPEEIDKAINKPALREALSAPPVKTEQGELQEKGA